MGVSEQGIALRGGLGHGGETGPAKPATLSLADPHFRRLNEEGRSGRRFARLVVIMTAKCNLPIGLARSAALETGHNEGANESKQALSK
jgi:hypothetical protein